MKPMSSKEYFDTTIANFGAMTEEQRDAWRAGLMARIAEETAWHEAAHALAHVRFLPGALQYATIRADQDARGEPRSGHVDWSSARIPPAAPGEPPAGVRNARCYLAGWAGEEVLRGRRPVSFQLLASVGSRPEDEIETDERGAYASLRRAFPRADARFLGRMMLVQYAAVKRFLERNEDPLRRVAHQLAKRITMGAREIIDAAGPIVVGVTETQIERWARQAGAIVESREEDGA